MTQANSSFKNKEIEGLLPDRLPTLKVHDISQDDSITLHANDEKIISSESQDCKFFMQKETVDFENSVNTSNIRRKKLSKSLIAFRVTLFLWYGASSLPRMFLGIFLKHRGLTVVEISSVFSMIFAFQFTSCFITGIITDKIGNAKPVLTFLMLFTFSVVISMAITPNVNSISCVQQDKNVNYSSTAKNNQNFTSCYNNCLQKNHSIFRIEANHTEVTSFENVSHVERFSLMTDNENICDFSNITLKNISFDSSKMDCCDVCADSQKVDCNEMRKSYLVVIYAILILAFYSVWNTTFRLMDFTAVSLSAKNNSHYGKERIFATCGMFLITVIVGIILNMDQSLSSKIDYDPIMWITASLQFCSFLALYLTKIPIVPPGKNLLKKGFSLLKDIDLLVFALLAFIAGNGFTFNFTFHLVFLETINAPKIVVFLHSVAVIFYAFPVLLTSQWWLDKFGTNKLFVLCLLSYTVNYAANSFIVNAWWILLIDVTAAFTNELFWVAIVVHCRNVAPVGLAATLNAVIGAVHFGIGRSSGVFFGGMLMNYMGPRTAYRIVAGIFFKTAVLYSLFLFCKRKSHSVINARYGTDTRHFKNTETSDV